MGGTSVEIALSTICGPHDIISPIVPIDELKRIGLGAHAQNYADVQEREREYIHNVQRIPIDELAQLPVPEERYFNHMSLREVIGNYGPAVASFEVVCAERSPYAQ